MEKNWKKTYGVRQIKFSGKIKSAGKDGADKFKLDIPKITEVFCKKQIFNADETALYYKMLLKRTLVYSTEKTAEGTKENKQRFTVMPCCNANGFFKLPLLVISKSKNPRAIKNLSEKVSSSELHKSEKCLDD